MELKLCINKLLPCPFCGSLPKIKSYGLDGWRIHCCKYGLYKGCCTFGDSIMSEDEIIKYWNTRANDNVKEDGNG